MADTGMSLTYNGITMDFVQTTNHSRIPVMNGSDWCRNRFELHVTAVINGETVTFRNNMKTAVTVDKEIRQRLTTPRGALTLTYLNENLLNVLPSDSGVKAAKATKDENQGPIPLHCNIVQVMGTKTFLVQWAVAFEISEPDGGKNAALISNRWSQTHDIDGQAVKTITTRGRACFNTAMLKENKENADDYRRSLLVPLPKGFRRENLQVSLSEGEQAIEYVITDKQVPMNSPKNGVMRVECRQGFKTTRRSLGENLTAWGKTIRRPIESGSEVLNDLREGKVGAIGKGTLAMADVGIDAWQSARGMLPVTTLVLEAEAYGSPTCSIKTLVDTVLVLLAVKTQDITTFGAGSEAELWIDYVNRAVVAELKLTTEPVLFMFGAEEGIDSNNLPEETIRKAVKDEEVKGHLEFGVAKDSPVPGKGDGVLVKLFTALLQDDPAANAPKAKLPVAPAAWPDKKP